MAAWQADINVTCQTVHLPDSGGIISFEAERAICWCGVVGWCHHVQDAVVMGDDDLYPMLAEQSIGTFTVPFLPNQGLWVPVDWSRISDQAFAITVPAEAINTEYVDSFLGVIGPGEGRSAVRDLLSNWFARQNADDSAQCESFAHGWKEERQRAATFRSGTQPERIASLWYLHWFHCCMPCMQKRITDFDDLIPDVPTGAAHRWNNGRLERNG